MAENKESNFLIKISKIGPGSHAATNFLKPDDVIVAVDGEPFHGTILEFSNILSEEDKKTLLTKYLSYLKKKI